MAYQHTRRFGHELTQIYTFLKACPRTTAVCRVASGIAHQNGIVFCWQDKRFGINWYKGYWYVSAQRLFFGAATTQDLIAFWQAMMAISPN